MGSKGSRQVSENPWFPGAEREWLLGVAQQRAGQPLGTWGGQPGPPQWMSAGVGTRADLSAQKPLGTFPPPKYLDREMDGEPGPAGGEATGYFEKNVLSVLQGKRPSSLGLPEPAVVALKEED